MKINYDQFEYDGEWWGKVDFNIGNTVLNVGVKMVIDEEDTIPEEYKNALEWYIDNAESFQDVLLNEILKYYCKERIELGYDESPDDRFPGVSDVSEISKMISLVQITIPDQDIYSKGVFLAFNCTWDKDEGLGVRIVDGKIIKIYDQSCAL